MSGLGRLDLQALAYLQSRELERIEIGELARSLGLTQTQERKILSRLARNGFIARVRRGLYLVPPRLPVGGKWSPGEASVITALIDDRKGRYQICGPNAFSLFGWDDQVPNRLYAYNNRLSGDRVVGSNVLMLIKVADERLGSTEVVRTPDGID